MKKKLILYCVVLLLMGSTANAALTTDTITDALTLNSSWIDGAVVAYYDHTWTFNTPLVSIDSATLEIVAYDVVADQGDIIAVSLDDQGLGNLNQGTSLANVTTTFDLASVLSELNDESATIKLLIPSNKSIKVKTSTLTINYTYGTEDQEPDPDPDPDPEPTDPVIPAPGAILLSSIGVGLVGWLRRRKTL